MIRIREAMAPHSQTGLPIPMYVCICNGVTDRDIRQAAEAGCKSIAELTMRTGVGATGGTCLDMAENIFKASRPRDAVVELPVLQAA